MAHRTDHEISVKTVFTLEHFVNHIKYIPLYHYHEQYDKQIKIDLRSNLWTPVSYHWSHDNLCFCQKNELTIEIAADPKVAHHLSLSHCEAWKYVLAQWSLDMDCTYDVNCLTVGGHCIVSHITNAVIFSFSSISPFNDIIITSSQHHSNVVIALLLHCHHIVVTSLHQV